MPIDPKISLGVQPIQIADPMARYSQLAGIQNAQNQNALAQYQLGSAQRTEKAQNLLADAYSQSTDPKTGEIDYNKLTGLVAAGGGGAQIPAIVKSRREGELAALTQREQQFKVEKSKNDFIAQAKRDTSQNPSDANLTAFKEDLIANPLFTAAEKTQYAANVDRILAMPVDQRRSFMASQGASPGELKPTVQSVNRGGQTDVLSVPAFTGPPSVVGTYADVPLSANVQAQKIDIARQSRPPAQPVAPTITTVEDPNNPGKFLQVDARTYKGGGAGAAGVIGGARPSATAEKTTAQRAQMGKDLGFAITQLSDITKDGGLIDQSTGSGAGQLVDMGAGFFGKATEGAIAIGKIAPVADLVLKMVPRFEGPQSNADTKSYKEAAGQLADASLPTKIRKEAGKTVLRIMKERKNQFVTTDMATEGAGADTTEGAVDTSNPLLKGK